MNLAAPDCEFTFGELFDKLLTSPEQEKDLPVKPFESSRGAWKKCQALA